MDDQPLAPEPDTKDWTWVIQQRCPECGFDGSAVDPRDVGDSLLQLLAQWHEVLADAGDQVPARWEPRTWSILEYTCHIRDVCRVYEGRVRRMLAEDGPHYDNWDQDATAVQERYDRSDPAVVATELAAAGASMADLLQGIPDDAWQRTGHRSDGASFTVATISVYFLHDIHHHLHDVRQGWERLRRVGA